MGDERSVRRRRKSFCKVGTPDSTADYSSQQSALTVTYYAYYSQTSVTSDSTKHLALIIGQ
jgi:hypothetical protein